MKDKLKTQIINIKVKSKQNFLSARYEGFKSYDEFLNKIAENLSNGIGFIELSGERISDSVFLELAKKTKQLCEIYNATIAIKNRTDIAYLSSADCVNLEQEAIDIHSASELLGKDFLIGLYSTPESIELSVKGGADYILLRNNISTPTEPVSSTGLEYAKWVSENHRCSVLSLNNADKNFPNNPCGLTYSNIEIV